MNNVNSEIRYVYFHRKVMLKDSECDESAVENLTQSYYILVWLFTNVISSSTKMHCVEYDIVRSSPSSLAL